MGASVIRLDVRVRHEGDEAERREDRPARSGVRQQHQVRSSQTLWASVAVAAPARPAPTRTQIAMAVRPSAPGQSPA